MEIISILILLAIISITPVSAQTIDTPASIFWKLKVAIEDFHEWISSQIDDKETQARIIQSHAEERQKEINEKILASEPIPIEYEIKRQEKIAKLEHVLTVLDEKTNESTATAVNKIKSIITNTIADLRTLNDSNDIRICFSDFQKLRDLNQKSGSIIQQETLANQIDNKCNKLQSAKKYCTQQISSLELASSKEPYIELQKLCPVLQKIPVTQARDLIYGN